VNWVWELNYPYNHAEQAERSTNGYSIFIIATAMPNEI
jgi:hypothetical protein